MDAAAGGTGVTQSWPSFAVMARLDRAISSRFVINTQSPAHGVGPVKPGHDRGFHRVTPQSSAAWAASAGAAGRPCLGRRISTSNTRDDRVLNTIIR